MLEKFRRLFRSKDQSTVEFIDTDDLDRLSEVTGHPKEYLEGIGNMGSGEIPPPEVMAKIDEEREDIHIEHLPINLEDDEK